MKRSFCLLAVLLACALGAQASAQHPRRYVPPGGPTMPSGLNYFRNDTGLLDPYNAFIAPQRQLNQELQNMAYQQQVDDLYIRRQLANPRDYRMAPTGTGASFMNYSHYYRMPVTPARRR